MKTYGRRLLLLAVMACTLPAARAATTIIDWSVGTNVPDNSSTGLVDTRVLSGSTILGITAIEVRLELDGGWNGDLYAYLTHDTGFSVLLNRVGKTVLSPLGSASAGFDITLSDLASTDIHNGVPSSGLVTGIFQPDARNSDPALVTDLSSRTAFLNSFYGLAADGSWSLFIADDSPGDSVILQSWGLTITGAVPEPSRAVLLMMGSAALFRRRRATRI